MTDSKINKDWHIKPSAKDVAEQARNIVLETAQQAIQERGVFKIVLAGGTTPEQVYTLLAQEACDWQNWQLYLGDERQLPIDDPERNSQMVVRTFLEKLPDKNTIPQNNIHFIPTELGVEQAREDYEQIIDDSLPFDMVLLGMGEDGHTASLFPDHEHDPKQRVFAVYNSPKAPKERVSLSYETLSQNRHCLIMVTGQGKHESVVKWQNGTNLPIAKIASLENMTVLLDSPALTGIS